MKRSIDAVNAGTPAQIGAMGEPLSGPRFSDIRSTMDRMQSQQRADRLELSLKRKEEGWGEERFDREKWAMTVSNAGPFIPQSGPPVFISDAFVVAARNAGILPSVLPTGDLPRAEATPAEPVSRVDPATGMTPKVAAMLERQRGGPLPTPAEAEAERLANIDRAEAAAVRVFAAARVGEQAVAFHRPEPPTELTTAVHEAAEHLAALSSESAAVSDAIRAGDPGQVTKLRIRAKAIHEEIVPARIRLALAQAALAQANRAALEPLDREAVALGRDLKYAVNLIERGIGNSASVVANVRLAVDAEIRAAVRAGDDLAAAQEAAGAS